MFWTLSIPRDSPGALHARFPRRWLKGKVWLLDWGCAIWSLCDFSTPQGMMWGWDPNTCCERHSFFPKNQTVKDWLADSIGTDYPRPFYDGYIGQVPVDDHGCRPEIWVNGRRASPVT